VVIGEAIRLPFAPAYAPGKLADVARFLDGAGHATDVAPGSVVGEELVVAQFEVKQVVVFGVVVAGHGTGCGQRRAATTAAGEGQGGAGMTVAIDAGEPAHVVVGVVGALHPCPGAAGEVGVVVALHQLVEAVVVVLGKVLPLAVEVEKVVDQATGVVVAAVVFDGLGAGAGTAAGVVNKFFMKNIVCPVVSVAGEVATGGGVDHTVAVVADHPAIHVVGKKTFQV